MEAKDTVMTQNEINAMEWSGDVGHLCKEIAKAQAEITAPIFFEEGRKAGKREVVEDIERQLAPEDTWFIAGRKWLKKWQAFLKEKGIKEAK
mgnify:FL=1